MEYLRLKHNHLHSDVCYHGGTKTTDFQYVSCSWGRILSDIFSPGRVEEKWMVLLPSLHVWSVSRRKDAFGLGWTLPAKDGVEAEALECPQIPPALLDALRTFSSGSWRWELMTSGIHSALKFYISSTVRLPLCLLKGKAKAGISSSGGETVSLPLIKFITIQMFLQYLWWFSSFWRNNHLIWVSINSLKKDIH